MINIPLKIRLPLELREINDFRIAWFQDNTLQNPNPHWYVIIRIVKTENFLIIIITSKKDKRANYYRNTGKPKAADCLVAISNNEFAFLSKDSAVNCNATECLSITEIVHRVDEKQGFKIEKEKVPSYLRKEIVSAAIKSPLIPRIVRDLAKASNPI